MICAFRPEIGLRNYLVIEKANIVYGSTINGVFALNGKMAMLFMLKSQIIIRNI